MRIGVWQDDTPKGGLPSVLTRIETALIAACDDGVDILVFPECFLTGYYRPEDAVPTLAASVTPDIWARLQSLADRAQVAFVLGSYRPTNTGVANSAFVFRPDQSPPLIYDKRALYGDWEKSVFQRGSAPLSFRYKGTNFAVLICFDVEFPELVREATRLGAQAVLVPTALMSPDHWVPDIMVPCRALENNVTLAYANRIGTEDQLTFIGKSQLCDGMAARRIVATETQSGLIAFEHQENPDATDYLGALTTLKASDDASR